MGGFGAGKTKMQAGKYPVCLLFSFQTKKRETFETQTASLISFSLGVFRGRLAAPPRACEPINTSNQAITLL